jgi:hypothetical protein
VIRFSSVGGDAWKRRIVGDGHIDIESCAEMEKKIASDILSTLNESAFVVDKTLGEIKNSCPDEQFRVCARLLGTVMSDMFDSAMAPIYDEHPDLAPEWYRDGPPRARPDITALKLDAAMQHQLVVAFNIAYEKVQLLLGQVSSLEDPWESALMRHGLHQISVSICRAQMALLIPV